MSDAKYYAKFKSTHARGAGSHRPKHAKPTRWARAVARVESIKMWAEIAFAPVVFA